MDDITWTGPRNEILRLFLPPEALRSIEPVRASNMSDELIRCLTSLRAIPSNATDYGGGLPGTLSARVPGTNLHVKITKALYDVLKLAVFVYLASTGEVLASTVHLADTLAGLKATIARLNEEQGQTCLYEKIIEARPDHDGGLGKRWPSVNEVAEHISNTRQECPSQRCRFATKAGCTVTGTDVQRIIADMIKLGVVDRKPDDGIWVVV